MKMAVIPIIRRASVIMNERIANYTVGLRMSYKENPKLCCLEACKEADTTRNHCDET